MMTVAQAPRAEENLAGVLGEFVSARLGRAVTVGGLRRLAGGTAHETWAFDVDGPDGVEDQEPHRLVLRRDFDRGMLDSDLDAEFGLLTALWALGVPVPRPWWCVVRDSPLGQPFMIVDRADGTDLRKYLAAHPDVDRHRLGRRLVALQCAVHRLDRSEVLQRLDASSSGPGGELRRWTQLIDGSGVDPGPLLRAATAWLERHVPGATPRRLVHGDFKTNNLLVGADGEITVLDWELAHLGDPAEDVAWTMLWTTRYDLVGGMLSAEEYRAAYQAESGTELDPGALLFWRIFALVKLAAIFLTGVASGGSDRRPTLLLMGRGLHHLEAELGELLGPALDEAGTR
jgi:aminoglycoside phosphotransferase (APT) family kinase protein